MTANDPALLAAALGDIAKASGITREALYKALCPDAQPRFDTVCRVCAAFGGTGCSCLSRPPKNTESIAGDRPSPKQYVHYMKVARMGLKIPTVPGKT